MFVSTYYGLRRKRKRKKKRKKKQKNERVKFGSQIECPAVN